MDAKQISDPSHWTIFSLLISSKYRRAVALIILFHVGQQFSGINAVFYYSTKIFEGIGLNIIQSQYASVGTVLLNVLFAMVAMYLVRICRRRTVLLSSVAGCVVCLVGLTISMQLKEISWTSYLTLSFFMSYVCLFASGYGTIPWTLPSELVDAQATSSAMALGGLFNWSSNFCVALLFPTCALLLGHFVFLLFAAFSAFVVIFGYFFLPETNPRQPKNATILSINDDC